jgi:UDP-N-acetylglucosamine--N-acetylmuramyl-(pentapeptide) pyrophosphoryl-undecaprenol N-acetylglucosamine transferase
MPKKTKKYFLAGGGSGGPVAPMLALASALKKKLPDYEPMLVGHGDPEARMAKAEGIKVLHITAGKYRRYFSLENILTPLWVLIGFFQSLVLIRRYRPAFIFGTGSFVQVPVMWAGWLLGVPVFVHQQRPLLRLPDEIQSQYRPEISHGARLRTLRFFQEQHLVF